MFLSSPKAVQGAYLQKYTHFVKLCPLLVRAFLQRSDIVGACGNPDTKQDGSEYLQSSEACGIQALRHCGPRTQSPYYHLPLQHLL